MIIIKRLQEGLNRYLKVDAVVVTYNRLEKLKECINSLLLMNLQKIIVINNNSNDGTNDYLKELSINNRNVISYKLRENVVGAGGFNFGLKKFIENSDSDYVWIMDDDTIPTAESLEKLVHGIEKIPSEKRGFAVGQIYWTDGSLARMNIPTYFSIKEYESEDIKTIQEASFVAILFPRETIVSVGYPIKDFFIWGDDVEYTRRICKLGLIGIQVIDAEILHKMSSNNSTNIIHENQDIGRIKRYFFDFRNRIYLSKEKGTIFLLKTLCGRGVWLFRILFYKNNHKLLKSRILFKGTIEGLRFNPMKEKVNRKYR